MKNEFKELVGKTITGIRLNPARDIIRFDTEESGPLYFGAVGDCCSNSWFEHFDGLQALLGQKITGLEDKTITEKYKEGDFNYEEYDSIEQYGITFETKMGRATLEMRNNSNGYYGGYVVPYNEPNGFDVMKEYTTDF